MFFDPFSLMFSIFPLIVMVLFVVILVRGLREWSRNNAAPPAERARHRCDQASCPSSQRRHPHQQHHLLCHIPV